MSVFVDTSAFLAVMDGGDENHLKASRIWRRIVSGDDLLITSNYVLVETLALVQHRMGMEAVTSFEEDVAPLLEVEWIGESAHHAGVTTMIGAGRRMLSLVDCTSFDLMRTLGIRSAFAFDRHFREQGFTLLA